MLIEVLFTVEEPAALVCREKSHIENFYRGDSKDSFYATLASY